MEKVSTEILNAVAPCSMFCSTCTGCKYGDISMHAKELLRLLDGHKEFLDKNNYTSMDDEMSKHFDNFMEKVELLRSLGATVDEVSIDQNLLNAIANLKKS